MEANSLFGRPWNDVARYDSFEEADKKRKQLAQDKELQVKIKKQLKGFVVKARSIVVEQPKQEVREKKHPDRSNKRKERRNDR